LDRSDGERAYPRSGSRSGCDPVDNLGAAIHAGFPAFTPEALQRAMRLTRRERDVLEGLATGASTAEAARRLRISDDDVRAVVRNCKRTLHAGSKLEAVLMALAAEVI